MMRSSFKFIAKHMNKKSRKNNLSVAICLVLSVGSVIFAQQQPSCVAETEKMLIEAENTQTYTVDFTKADECVRQNPKSVEALILRSRLLALKGELETALNDANKAIKLAPNSSEAFYARGFVYHKKYDKNSPDKPISVELKKSAMADYNKALSLNPKNGVAQLDRTTLDSGSYTLRRIPDYNLAIEYLMTGNNTTELARAYYVRGYIYLTVKRFNEAISDFTMTIKLRPNYSSAFSRRAFAYKYRKDKGDVDAAIADCTEFIRIKPNDTFGYIERGGLYERKGETEKAVSDYRAALALDPNTYSTKTRLVKLGVQP